MGENYWKEAYKDTWAESSERENRLMEYLEMVAGVKCELFGLGAGSAEYIDGNAEKNKHHKGDADIRIIGTNIYVEATGPLTTAVGPEKALWFRPDKIDNAVRNSSRDVFLAHHCMAVNLWRVIHIDDEFKKQYLKGSYPVIAKNIRGRRETYVEIKAEDPCVRPLAELVEYLKRTAQNYE